MQWKENKNHMWQKQNKCKNEKKTEFGGKIKSHIF